MRKSLGSNYNCLWISSGLSNFGDGIFKFALPLLAAQFTSSPFDVSLVSVFLSLPWLFFALPAGALADRMDRRRTMMRINAMRAFVLTGVTMAAVADTHSLNLLYVAALTLGIGETLFDTAGQAIIPSLVHKDDLARANGRLFATEDLTNQLIGPAIGGILVGLAFEYAFAASAASFALAAATLTLIRGVHRAERGNTDTTMRAEIGEGLRYLFHDRMLRTLATMVALGNMAFTAALAIFPLWAEGKGSSLGLSKFEYGLLFSINAAGGLSAAFITDRFHDRIRFRPALLVGLGAMLFMPLTLAVTTNVALVATSFFVSGFGVLLWNIMTVSARQRLVPDRLQGRVSSAYRLLSWGSIPIAAALAGALGELVSLRAVFWMSTAFAVMAICMFALLRSADTAAVDRSAAHSGP